MDKQVSDQVARESALFELGKVLGQQKMLGMVSGRCTAAEAAVVRRIREETLYRPTGLAWSEFCPRHLGMSRAQADRIIRHLEEFGPEFFELTQLARIPPDAYRTISFAVREGKIYYRGEGIPLLPQNTERIAEVVTALRTQYASRAPAKEPGDSRSDPIQQVCVQTTRMLDAWYALLAKRDRLTPEELGRLGELMAALRLELDELEHKIRRS